MLAVLEGFFHPLNRKVSLIERTLLIIRGLLLIDSGLLTDIIEVAIALMVVVVGKVWKGRAVTVKRGLWPERAPSRQSGIGGVKGHNTKRNYLAGKPRPVAVELHLPILISTRD